MGFCKDQLLPDMLTNNTMGHSTLNMCIIILGSYKSEDWNSVHGWKVGNFQYAMHQHVFMENSTGTHV